MIADKINLAIVIILGTIRVPEAVVALSLRIELQLPVVDRGPVVDMQTVLFDIRRRVGIHVLPYIARHGPGYVYVFDTCIASACCWVDLQFGSWIRIVGGCVLGFDV